MLHEIIKGVLQAEEKLYQMETWIFGRDENVLEIANNRVYVID